MEAIIDVFTQNIIPILLVAAIGYWLRRQLGVPARPVSSVVFNVFSPALVFVSLVNSELPPGELLGLLAFAVITILVMGGLAALVGSALRLPRADVITLLLVVMFVNGGNYGLTLNRLRYGEDGLSRAVVYFVVSTMFVYTLGVFIASMGRSSIRGALVRLARVPTIYAVALAIVVYALRIPMPGPIMSTLEIVADGAIPTMLVVLGMNMAAIDGVASWRLALPAVSLRLLVAPLLAMVVAGLLGLQGLSYSTSIIEASMPTAVITSVIATEYEVQPPIVTSIVVLTTLLSPITLAMTITLLGL
ncbi:MAG: AEC family transporter [Chloroflexi bacterium]|nr:AEC family transporter [Chloroflexota bacterium]